MVLAFLFCTYLCDDDVFVLAEDLFDTLSSFEAAEHTLAAELVSVVDNGSCNLLETDSNNQLEVADMKVWDFVGIEVVALFVCFLLGYFRNNFRYCLLRSLFDYVKKVKASKFTKFMK